MARVSANVLLLAALAALPVVCAHGHFPLSINETTYVPNDGSFVVSPPTTFEAAGMVKAAPSFSTGPGKWCFGGSSSVLAMHQNLLPTGPNAGKTVFWEGPQPLSSYWDPKSNKFKSLRGSSGIGAGKTAFCTAHVITVRGDIVIIGGHTDNTNVVRHWSYDSDSVKTLSMEPGRWYAGAATLADGNIMIIGGATKYVGYFKKNQALNNPTNQVCNPSSKKLGKTYNDMEQQLRDAFPVQTYPFVALLPDGNLVVNSGNIMVNYKPKGSNKFGKFGKFGNVPWSYPQTGQGILLPFSPPYDSAKLLVSGGSKQDFATSATSASSGANVIDLMAGSGAGWKSVGFMPYARVMGDALYLCDGTIFYAGGASTGTAGYYTPPKPTTYTVGTDGTEYKCTNKCPHVDNYLYSPTIYDPASNKWAKKDSLAKHKRARLYHATTLLLPDCRVVIGGGDTTQEHTLEVYTPAYLNKGPQPKLLSAPKCVSAGYSITATFSMNGQTSPIKRALLIRTGTATHTMSFDARAIFLAITSQTATSVSLELPTSSNVLVPGWYLLVLLTDSGVPSTTKFVQAT